MSVRVDKSQKDGTILGYDLPLGAFGVATWGKGHETIVRRESKDLVGVETGESQSHFFLTCPVRRLPPGTLLYVTQDGLTLEKHNSDGTIPASELRDGQMGEVVGDARYSHWIVQRNSDDRLVTLGHDCGDSFTDLDHLCFRVRPLANGTRLVVEGNE